MIEDKPPIFLFKSFSKDDIFLLQENYQLFKRKQSCNSFRTLFHGSDAKIIELSFQMFFFCFVKSKDLDQTLVC